MIGSLSSANRFQSLFVKLLQKIGIIATDSSIYLNKIESNNIILVILKTTRLEEKCDIITERTAAIISARLIPYTIKLYKSE